MRGIIGQRLARVHRRIGAAAARGGRNPSEITLVLASKGVGIEALREAAEAGATVFGENRVQEAVSKMAALGRPFRWHLIGHLQRNKARLAVGAFELIHSVDGREPALEMDRRAARARIRQEVLVQVNVGREGGKHGVAPEGLGPLVREIAAMPNLRLRGLMAIPPMAKDPEASRPFFRQLAETMARLNREGFSLNELSMGMSNDFEAAIEEGATLVRVGTAIFGPREENPHPESEG